MSAQTPKKEFVINYTKEEIKEAIFKFVKTDPNSYELVKDDSVLNEIRLLQKGNFKNNGHHIDFTLSKISDTETKVVVEVNSNRGSLSSDLDVSIANTVMKNVTSKFSSFLSGNTDPVIEKAKAPKQGCMLTLLILLSAISGGTYGILKLFSL